MIIFTPNSATFTSSTRNPSAVIVTATLDYFNAPEASVYLNFSHKGLLQLERRKIPKVFDGYGTKSFKGFGSIDCDSLVFRVEACMLAF